MKNKNTILGICILLSSIFISTSIIINSFFDRYYFLRDDSVIICDKFTGTYYKFYSGKWYKIEVIKDNKFVR